MGWKHTALSAVRRTGGLSVLQRTYGRDRLTVLAYHRVTDHAEPGFIGFRGNVGATPAEFVAQMDWIAERLSPVSLQQVVRSLDGPRLPEGAVLVTFDDGYRDNLTNALPVLESRGIPAVIFLATDHIGTGIPFWWDRAGWWFARAGAGEADLPVLGRRSWSDHLAMALEWIQAAKALEHEERIEAVEALGATLGAGEPDGFRDLLLDWDDVRTMQERGCAIGAHTCSHPILTRLDPDRGRIEIMSSVERVREETGGAVGGFAYPNGQRGDFAGIHRSAVAEAGVPLAFSLVPGPARAREVTADPLAIRRVYVHHGDEPDRFAAKVAGVARLVRWS